MSPVATMESREFLTSCLTAALDDPDLVDAISDQAFEQGLDAISIGRGEVSVDELKDKLYLTVEEAKSVLSICSARIAGMPSKQSTDDVALRLFASPSGRLALNLDVKSQQLLSAPDSKANAEADLAVQAEDIAFEPLESIMENAAVVVVSRAPAHGSSEKKLLGAVDPFALLPAAAATITPTSPEPALAPAQPASPAPVAAPTPAPAESAKPVTPTKSPAVPSIPVKAASPAPTASPSPAFHVRSAGPKLSNLVLQPEPSPASPRLPSPTAATSPVSAPPSYLRPTAAHKARVSKDVDNAAALSPAVTPEEQQRRRNVFSRMASTLLAPTQAFVARVTGRSEEVKSKKDAPVTKASVQLESMLGSPQGQRITKPQPFMLRSEMRGKSCMLSTEDLQLAEAREKAFKRNPVPKHVHESRPIAPVQRSAPKDPDAVFEPFQLASVELHKKKMERLKQKQEEEAAREAEARRFKARSFDPSIASSPVKPAKPPASPPTRAAAPNFASEARIAYYHEVIEPAKKAKEAEANKEKLEAERKAKELDDMTVDEFRKTLEFKARPMPDFSAPFRVDPSLARPVTTATEPELHTVKRLGAAPSPGSKQDKDGSGLGNGVYDGAGYVDPFFASLRKSTSLATRGPAAASTKASTASVRRSAVVRQSTGSACPGGSVSNHGVRGSVGSALQAAIRAAARDAARDLATAGCNVESQPSEEAAN